MNLKQIRKRLDEIDSKIVVLIALRQSYMPAVAKYKKENGMPLFQPKREREIIQSKKDMAKKTGANGELISKIFTLIFKNSREIQAKS